MNILVVGGMYPPMRTGTAFYTRNIAQALQARGHRVAVVSLGPSPSREEEGGLTVHRLPAVRLPLAGFFKHFQICAPNPRNWVRLHRITRDFGPDAVLLVNHYLDIAFPAHFAARMRNVPVVCSVGTQLQSLNPRRDRILNVLDRLICGQLVFPFCDRIVAWDNEILRYLTDVQGERIRRKVDIVNYGVNGHTDTFSAPRHDHGYRGTVLAVGAVSEQRSFVPLVQAFARIADEFPDLKLRVLGHVYFDAAVRIARERGLSDRISFVGEVPHATVMDEMRRADVLYASLTGRYVGLGTAPIEAMLLGVPTIVNVPADLLGGPRIENERHLVQCLSLEVDEIAAKLRRVLSDQPLRETLGREGRIFVQTHMNWSTVASDMERVLQSVVQEKDLVGA